jgi:hypothetical protein
MAGERTLYRKIQVTIEYAKEEAHDGVNALEEYIYQRSPTNFVYYWRDDLDAIKHDYSRNSIINAVQLCIDLGLISEKDGRLTEIGVSATDPRRFPMIVGNRVSKLLSKRGASIETIMKAINSIVNTKLPKPPTAEEIWNHFEDDGIEMDLQTFKRLINLLGECKVLLMTQKRIYLPVSK